MMRRLALAAVVLLAAPATALEIHIGGVDAETQYTGAGVTGAGASQAGVLTFYDALNGMNSPDFGVVDSEDLAGFDLIGGIVGFEAILSATGNDGNPFDPATDNLRKARFVGTGGSELSPGVTHGQEAEAGEHHHQQHHQQHDQPGL